MDDIRFEPADIAIYLHGRGMVLKEKSIVAFNAEDKKIVAFGTEAEYMEGKESGGIKVLSPLRQGMVADYVASVCLFAHLLYKAWGKKPFFKPPVAVCVPKGITEVEKKAMEEVLYQSGVKEVMISDMPWQQLASERPEEFSKLRAKFTTVIEITKENPESYITEELTGILQYARQEGISAARVAELLRIAGR